MCKVGTCCKVRIYQTEYCYDHKHLVDAKSAEESADILKTIDVVVEPKKKESGGAPTHVLPFVQACKLLKEGKISKNKWKKARKQYEKERASLAMASFKAAEARLGSNVVVGEVVH
jgi:hypothetical protein